ncbi:MAG: hypothetical protein JWL69_1334 [Phycisphaerales bacterium]|nr:hypothetical protein [Phycisphaerales bacterium]
MDTVGRVEAAALNSQISGRLPFLPRRPAASFLKIEAIQVHHLCPRRDEVADELLFRIGAGVHFGQGPELGV